MSVTQLGQELLDADPAVVARLLEGLDPDEAAVVQAAIEQADVEAWQAGREVDALRRDAEVDGAVWASTMFPFMATATMAQHMEAFWRWVWTIQRGQRSRPRVEVWGRGMAKSSSAEAAVAAVAATGRRAYGLYVSATQKLADEHVASIGGLMESRRFALAYPDTAARAVGLYGNVKGWRRNRLSTGAGFVIDALGLQAAARGIKTENQRPDFIVLDDIDARDDGPDAIAKKLDLITTTLLPAGTTDMVVLGVQNVIHPNSIFAQLANLTPEPADFLVDRIVVGPIPLVRDMEVSMQTNDEGQPRAVIVGGTPSWPGGKPLDACQADMDRMGLASFMQECQHLTKPAAGGLFSDLTYQRCRPDAVPRLAAAAVWLDPAVTSKDSSDSQGVQCDGLGVDGVIYRLHSWEERTSPQDAMRRAIMLAIVHGANTVGAETNQGGDTWDSVFAQQLAVVRTQWCETCRTLFDDADQLSAHEDREGHQRWTGLAPIFEQRKAPSDMAKVSRANEMLADYGMPGHIVHVEGTHPVLEAALFRFPKVKPLDLVDAAYWCWRDMADRRQGSPGLKTSRRVLAGGPRTRNGPAGLVRTPGGRGITRM